MTIEIELTFFTLKLLEIVNFGSMKDNPLEAAVLLTYVIQNIVECGTM